VKKLIAATIAKVITRIGVRFDKAGNHAKRRCLAAARRTQQADELAVSTARLIASTETTPG